MNENAWQQQNPRIKGSFGGSTKASEQGPKSVGRRNCGEVRSPQNETGLPWKEGAHASSGVRSRLTPSASQIHRGGKKSPPKQTPSHSPRYEETQSLPRGAGRGQGRAPCQGGTKSSPGMRQPHILFRGPHTQARRGSSLSRGVPQRLTPLGVPRKADRSSHILPTYVAGWGVVTQSQPVPGYVLRDSSQMRGTPEPHTPQSGGTDPPQLRGPPDAHTALTDPLTPSHGRGRGQSHSPTALRGV